MSYAPSLKLKAAAELERRRRQPQGMVAPELLPWQREPWNDQSFFVLLTGAAGGGKSYLPAHKIHAYCNAYPGTMALALRKTRESMKNSTVLYLARKVIGKAARHNMSAHRFEYPNGSILAYGGMKDEEQREQVRSLGQDGGVDIVWMEEANAFAEEDLNELIARCRGKAGPYRQILLGTNPDSPMHWIHRRLIVGGEASVYYSSAIDNPNNPAEYIENLNRLTGVEYDRLVLGKWLQATGLVYDVWSDGPETGNVTEDAEYVPGVGALCWAVDDGYSPGSAPNTKGIDPATGHYVGDSHPRVFLLVQEKPDGHIDVFAEHYACQLIEEEHLSQVKELGYPEPDWVAIDKSAAQLRGRLQQEGMYARNGPSDVEESIKELRRRLAPDTNNWRAVRVHPRCKHLRAEMASYRRDDRTEKPIKQFDHGPDALRYLTWALRYS